MEKEYELRPLVATDMGAICKIITAIGIKQLKTCFSVEDAKGLKEGKDVESLGFGIMFDIAGVIISNIPKAEKEIQSFLANLTGLKVEDIQKMSFADYGEMIMDVVMKEEFRDFFSRVMKLFSR